jgi:hypothetical protein
MTQLKKVRFSLRMSHAEDVAIQAAISRNEKINSDLIRVSSGARG